MTSSKSAFSTFRPQQRRLLFRWPTILLTFPSRHFRRATVKHFSVYSNLIKRISRVHVFCASLRFEGICERDRSTSERTRENSGKDKHKPIRSENFILLLVLNVTLNVQDIKVIPFLRSVVAAIKKSLTRCVFILVLIILFRWYKFLLRVARGHDKRVELKCWEVNHQFVREWHERWDWKFSRLVTADGRKAK
jgi:hypothetical protein